MVSIRPKNWFKRSEPKAPASAPAQGLGGSPSSRSRWWAAGIGVAVLIAIAGIVSFHWSREPDLDDPGMARTHPDVTGYATVTSLIDEIDWLLDKPGGYLSNDIAPPGVWLDNMPNFEFGVLVQCRDLARVLRNDFSRSQSQSTEDADLAIAEPALNFSNDSWIFPTTESKLRESRDALLRYRSKLVDTSEVDAQFFARADNLREWLAVVERRLGSLSQRLTASVGQARINTDLAGSPTGQAATPRGQIVVVKTPWLELDDVFYEARGTAWALHQFLNAVEIDFHGVLEDKNAVVSIEQVNRELESALAPVWSPIILNGRGFGLLANHSLVLASYLSRAHTAVLDVRELLEQG